MLFTVCDSSEK